MIVKNEENVILRCLNSVLPIIDCYCIVDTGSTDNTKSLIIEFFQNHNVKGAIYDYVFTNYADSRNFAIQKAKEHADWAFTIDADETLQIERTYSKEKLKESLKEYHCACSTIWYKNIYPRKNFFRTSMGFFYTHPVHELLESKVPTRETFIHSIKTIVNKDGYSWMSQDTKQKYLSHAKLLLEEVHKKNAPPSNFFPYPVSIVNIEIPILFVLRLRAKGRG